VVVQKVLGEAAEARVEADGEAAASPRLLEESKLEALNMLTDRFSAIRT
jgi:hypothetical protein